ncbi:hypothetical protein [Dongia rigui]|uniref:Uncharacterized protein n=1 Tax=Dongia rigui TaxID=940149 RepID=A0ABU5DY33_9PROT|nr:hypothetical protein [Dongia rigui]MDY0871849.1 hypothetical protein [Dongia rigui]
MLLQSLSGDAATPSPWSTIAAVFGAWAAARACASALEFGRQPAPADLRRVGIDPVAFSRIRLY